MKKIILTALVLFGLNTMALEAGDLAQSGLSLNHLMNDGTEKTQDLLSIEKGQKFTVLEFFQTTCSACIENRPNFIALSNEFAKTASFKLVGLDRKEKALRDYFQIIKSEFSFPYVLDHLRSATKAYGVVATPTSFIVDANGKVLFKHEGTFESSDMQKIREILK